MQNLEGQTFYYVNWISEPCVSSKQNFGYCDEIRVQKDCLIFCRIVNNLANIEYKVNKVVVGV